MNEVLLKIKKKAVEINSELNSSLPEKRDCDAWKKLGRYEGLCWCIRELEKAIKELSEGKDE